MIERQDDVFVLRGGCDDLLTARPLGPIWDMSFDEPSLHEALAEDDREATFRALVELLTRSMRPTIIIIEDVHWADDATLDVIRFLGRDLATANKWIATQRRAAERLQRTAFVVFGQSLAIQHDLLAGDWVAAQSAARQVVNNPITMENACTAATRVLAQLLIRTGNPDAKTVIQDAWRLANMTKEPAHLGRTAGTVAEYVWLGGWMDDAITNQLLEVLDQMKLQSSPWYVGELALWLWLDGRIDAIPVESPPPYRMLGNGEWEKAAEWFSERSIPYEKALALTLGDTEDKLEALTILDGVGADPLASKVRSQLKADGVTGIPRRSRGAANAGHLGLTTRQNEVLGLLGEGLTNGEIADRLYISTRTVDHHVSAILNKLGVNSRKEAVTAASEAGNTP